MSNMSQVFSMGAFFGAGLASIIYLAIWCNMKWKEQIKEWGIIEKKSLIKDKIKTKLIYFLAGVGFAGILFTSEELSKEWQLIINNLIH